MLVCAAPPAITSTLQPTPIAVPLPALQAQSKRQRSNAVVEQEACNGRADAEDGHVDGGHAPPGSDLQAQAENPTNGEIFCPTVSSYPVCAMDTMQRPTLAQSSGLHTLPCCQYSTPANFVSRCPIPFPLW